MVSWRLQNEIKTLQREGVTIDLLERVCGLSSSTLCSCRCEMGLFQIHTQPQALSTTFKHVYLDICHKSGGFWEAGVSPGYGAGGLSCSNDNLWFGVCSTAYKEGSD